MSLNLLEFVENINLRLISLTILLSAVEISLPHMNTLRQLSLLLLQRLRWIPLQRARVGIGGDRLVLCCLLLLLFVLDPIHIVWMYDLCDLIVLMLTV